jgi:alpha-beta hydrolase superfamily lysophospholipase
MAIQGAQAATVPSDEFSFTSEDGLVIACSRWDARGPARGALQIAHGMGEHIGRYLAAIEALAASGFRVYGNDHRGHGRTARSPEERGDFGEGGFDLLVRDMVRLSRVAKQENSGLPFFLMGHSMGSFASQLYTLDHSRGIDGLILSGSGALDGLARLANSVPPGTNILNAKFEPARTALDWLTRDEAIVDRFVNDPLCFPQLQPASFGSFLAAAPRLAHPENLRRIRHDLPVYIFSGSEDPVGQQLEGVKVLIERYRTAGLRQLSYDFYPGGRHEMLNEINRAEVLEKLLDWTTRTLDEKGFENSKLPDCDATGKEVS